MNKPRSKKKLSAAKTSTRVASKRKEVTVFLLRGWGRESGHWGNFPARLAKSLGVRVVCLDLPGSGSRVKEKSPITIQGQVDAVRLRLATKKTRGASSHHYYLLAISMGSMVAANWALRFPQEILGVIMINPSFKDLSPWYRRLKLEALPVILSAVFESDPYRSELKVLSQVSNDPSLYPSTAKAWSRIRMKRPISRFNFFRQLVAASLASIPKQQDFKVPILVLGSKSDRLVDSAQCSQDTANALDAKLIFHPTAGHDIPLDDPLWLLEKIKAWMPRS